MTRKTASTDSHSRWRDAPMVPGQTRADDANPGAAQGSKPARAGIGSASQSSGVSPPRAEDPEHPPRSVSHRSTPSAAEQLRGPSVDPEAGEQTAPEGLLVRLGSHRNSSFLVSLAIHLILLIALALMTYRLSGGQKGLLLEGELGGSEPSTELLTLEQSPSPGAAPNPLKETAVALNVMSQESSDLPQDVVSPNQSSPDESASMANQLRGGGTAATSAQMYFGGGGMSARTPEGRKKYGDRYGATKESEQAVENALRWLANHQRSDGSWSFDLQLAPCDGRCRHGKKRGEDTPTPTTAATGLALLAFLGAGYTPEQGQYQDVVSRGVYYLRSVATESEYGYNWQHGGRMYAHAIALMAISETLGMTKREDRYDSDLLHYAERGSFFTVAAQHENGSWGYTPGSPGDTTLTGWQILSLIGAKKAGIQTRSDTFTRAKGFLMSVREGTEFQFGYRTPEAERTTTAIALTLLIYLGQTPGYTYFDRAIDKLAEDGPTLTNVYHDYYATMALHHFRHRDWETWNTTLRDHLVRTQETEGHEAGSWHFRDKWGDVGGRLYTTAMCALTLEVYYRFLPLYDEPPEFPL